MKITLSIFDPIDLGPGWPHFRPPRATLKEMQRRLVALGADPKGRFEVSYNGYRRTTTFRDIPLGEK